MQKQVFEESYDILTWTFLQLDIYYGDFEDFGYVKLWTDLSITGEESNGQVG